MSDPITIYAGRHEFLKYDYPVTVFWKGKSYPSAEAAVRAYYDFSGSGKMKDDWKIGPQETNIHTEVLRIKFHPLIHPKLAWKLVDTGDSILFESTEYNDANSLTGNNAMGEILMRIRDEIRPKMMDLAPRKQGHIHLHLLGDVAS